MWTRWRTPTNRAPTKQLLDELFPIVDEAYKNLREAIFGLRALALKSQVGLVAALGDFVSDFSEVRNLPVDLQVDRPDAVRFSPQVEIQLIRILHEALTNIIKHAQAKQVLIRIAVTGRHFVLHISDDGKGYDAEKASGRHGLAGAG